MRKLFLVLIFSLLVVVPVSAVDRYVTNSGAGDHNGTAEIHAWSVTEFNALTGTGYAGDTFYFSGGISTPTTPLIVGTLSNPINIDGWEGGTCAPRTSTCTNSALYSAQVNINTNYINWVDSRFVKGGTAIDIGYTNKVVGVKIERNHFDNSSGGGTTALRIWFACDSLFNDNNFISPYTEYTGNAFEIQGGSRNVITYNKVYEGTVGMYFKSSIQSFENNPSAEHDPDFNIMYNEIAYNYIERSRQEGISFDPSAGDNNGIREWDTVAAVSDNVVTLNHAGWSGESGTYVGYYMVGIEDTNDVFGQHSIITGHSNAVFTLEKAITNLKVGDHVAIQLVYRRNWIHHNTVDSINFSPSAILLDAGGIENLFENNGQVGGGMEIKIQSLFSYTRINGSVTGTYATGVSAFNVIRNNNLNSINMYAYNKGYGTPYYGVNTRNNSVYNNTLTVGIDSTLAFSYYNNNILGIEQDGCAPGCTVPTDPTAGLTGWPFTTASLAGANVAVNGTTLTLSFSENITQGGAYQNSDWNIDCVAGGIDIPIAYVSGNGTDTHVYTISQQVFHTDTCDVDFNGATNSMKDASDKDMAAIQSYSMTIEVPLPIGCEEEINHLDGGYWSAGLYEAGNAAGQSFISNHAITDGSVDVTFKVLGIIGVIGNSIIRIGSSANLTTPLCESDPFVISAIGEIKTTVSGCTLLDATTYYAGIRHLAGDNDNRYNLENDGYGNYATGLALGGTNTWDLTEQTGWDMYFRIQICEIITTYAIDKVGYISLDSVEEAGYTTVPVCE